jgi:hypothetical protein
MFLLTHPEMNKKNENDNATPPKKRLGPEELTVYKRR